MTSVGVLGGRRAVVTGASSGVGQAIAVELAARGARVSGLARRQPEVAGVAMHSVDVTNEAAVQAAFSAVGALDILVLAHGDGTFRPLAETTPADVQSMWEAHVLGTLHCLRSAQWSGSAGPARVVVISSIATRTAFAACSGYTAAKAGQLGLVRAAAQELTASVLVTNVLLGATDTAIWNDRPEFDRTQMLRPQTVAGVIVDLLTRPDAWVEELVLLPPAGRL